MCCVLKCCSARCSLCHDHWDVHCVMCIPTSMTPMYSVHGMCALCDVHSYIPKVRGGTLAVARPPQQLDLAPMVLLQVPKAGLAAPCATMILQKPYVVSGFSILACTVPQKQLERMGWGSSEQ